jgi:hypothetical protein
VLDDSDQRSSEEKSRSENLLGRREHLSLKEAMFAGDSRQFDPDKEEDSLLANMDGGYVPCEQLEDGPVLMRSVDDNFLNTRSVEDCSVEMRHRANSHSSGDKRRSGKRDSTDSKQTLSGRDPSPRGWRTADGKLPSSLDDITALVIPLHRAYEYTRLSFTSSFLVKTNR